MKKYLIVVLTLILLLGVLSGCDSKAKQYGEAVNLMKAGEYDLAAAEFAKLGDYKDSKEQYSFCKIPVGSEYTFGSYEQDNDTSNGKEAIEWIVLEKQEGKLMLISKYGLDCQPYNTEYAAVTWETCSLRKWLNSTFLSEAFSQEESKQIMETKVSADKNPEYYTDPGNSTEDKVYLLSVVEAEKYFTGDEARKCVPTSYANARGATTKTKYTVDGKGTCWWWLRSPGNNRYCAANVDIDGSVYYYGYSVYYGHDAVRPVIWIDLAS